MSRHLGLLIPRPHATRQYHFPLLGKVNGLVSGGPLHPVLEPHVVAGDYLANFVGALPRARLDDFKEFGADDHRAPYGYNVTTENDSMGDVIHLHALSSYVYGGFTAPLARTLGNHFQAPRRGCGS